MATNESKLPRNNRTRPIVCGTDFSATAAEAVEIAAAMARSFGTKLVLVHVDEFHGMAAVDPTLFEAALSQKRGDLDREADRLRNAGTVVEDKLLSGSVFDELMMPPRRRRGAFSCSGPSDTVSRVGCLSAA